jgi:hypothetical protein
MIIKNEAWIRLAQPIIGEVLLGWQMIKFQRNFGCPPDVCRETWNMIQIKFPNSPVKPKHLLWALYFLCKYPTQEDMLYMFDVKSEKTLCKWLIMLVEMISSLKPQVVSKIL